MPNSNIRPIVEDIDKLFITLIIAVIIFVTSTTDHPRREIRMDDPSFNDYGAHNTVPYSYSFNEYGNQSGGRECNLTQLFENCTESRNATGTDEDVPRDFAVRIFIAVLFAIIIIATIVGK